MKKLLLAATILSCAAGAASAAPTVFRGILPGTVPGVAPNADVDIEDVIATLTFNFLGGTYSTAFAGGVGSVAGIVSLTGSGPAGSDNGGPSAWTLETLVDGLVSFSIDLAPSFAFDKTFPSPGAGDVGNHWNFLSSSEELFGNIDVALDDRLLGSSTDQYRSLDVSLLGLTGPTAGSMDIGTMDFSIDVDAVPLPAAGWLMLTAFGGMAATRRLKAKAS